MSDYERIGDWLWLAGQVLWIAAASLLFVLGISGAALAAVLIAEGALWLAGALMLAAILATVVAVVAFADRPRAKVREPMNEYDRQVM